MQKRILSLFLALALLCGLLPQMGLTAHAKTYSGTCGAEGDGSNLRWLLITETLSLSIEGSGEMADYNNCFLNRRSPWYGYHNTIKTVSMPEELTSFGDWAFSYCWSLTSMTIPDSVVNIGDDAFDYVD